MIKDLENKILEVADLIYNTGYTAGSAENGPIGYDKGYKYGNKIGYDQGLNDAWECARKITNDMTSEDLESCNLFANVSYDEDYEYSCKVIKMYSASQAISKIKEYEEQQRQKWEDDFENKQLEQLCNHLEQQKKIEKSCDNCGHRFDVSCEILDSGECCINEGKWIPKQTEEKTDKSCDDCRFADLTHHEFPCSACSASHTFRWEPRKGAEK